MRQAEPRFYLDYNASAPLRAGVLACMEQVASSPGNASSVHSFGRRARGYIDDARASIANAMGCEPEGVIFTSGGSEANALILHDREHFFCSAIEHPSVLAHQANPSSSPASSPASSPSSNIIPVLSSGIVDCRELERMLSARQKLVSASSVSASSVSTSSVSLVSIMAANNETGVLQPIEEVSSICRRFGVALHCDATQAVGRLSVSLRDWGVDFLTLSAHKIGGPQGVGALLCSPELDARAAASTHQLPRPLLLRPLLLGGGQEFGLRAGTENTAAIAGFAFALTAACAERTQAQKTTTSLRDSFESRLLARLPDTRIVGSKVERLGNTSCLIHPRLSAEVLLMRCDLSGVAISSGSACSSGKISPSHVLLAMGYDEASCRRAIRVSLRVSPRVLLGQDKIGEDTTSEETTSEDTTSEDTTSEDTTSEGLDILLDLLTCDGYDDSLAGDALAKTRDRAAV